MIGHFDLGFKIGKDWQILAKFWYYGDDKDEEDHFGKAGSSHWSCGDQNWKQVFFTIKNIFYVGWKVATTNQYFIDIEKFFFDWL